MLNRVSLLAVCFAVFVGDAGKSQAGEERLIAETTKDGVRVSSGKKTVLFYQRTTKSLAGKFARANYVHPLHDLDGNILTEDFPADHKHHRGIFWAWHQVKIGGKSIGDGWACERFVWDVKEVKPVSSADGSLTLHTRVEWKSPDWAPTGKLKSFVLETASIRVFPLEHNTRTIDFEIRLQALEKDLSIAGSDNDKGYGGFSIRTVKPAELRFRGANGPVTPLRTPVAAGRWLDMRNANKSHNGIAILTHPSLPEFPPPWILRNGLSMQNVVYPGQHLKSLSQKKPLVLRYRLVLHRGDVEQTVLKKWQCQFESRP